MPLVFLIYTHCVLDIYLLCSQCIPLYTKYIPIACLITCYGSNIYSCVSNTHSCVSNICTPYVPNTYPFPLLIKKKNLTTLWEEMTRALPCTKMHYKGISSYSAGATRDSGEHCQAPCTGHFFLDAVASCKLCHLFNFIKQSSKYLLGFRMSIQQYNSSDNT